MWVYDIVCNTLLFIFLKKKNLITLVINFIHGTRYKKYHVPVDYIAVKVQNFSWGITCALFQLINFRFFKKKKF